MGKYIHKFESLTDYNNTRQNNYIEPWISVTNDGEGFIDNYNKTEYESLLETPLTFEIISGGTLYWRTNDTNLTRTIEYKKNDGEWIEVTSSQDNDGLGTIICTVIGNDIVRFRGNNSSGYGNYHQFKTSNGCSLYAYGNINSLLSKEQFVTITTITNTGYIFSNLFMDLSALTSHLSYKLLLPATDVKGYGAYMAMFKNCINITKLPVILGECINGNSTYANMFEGCTSLIEAPKLPTTLSSQRTFMRMFLNCTNLVTPPKLPSTNLTQYCYLSMFEGCTSLTTAPELPATILVGDCYYRMFFNCSNLNNIKCLATDISATRCTSEWVKGVQTNSGTFVKDPNMTSWTTGNDGIPTNWTIQNA